MHKLAEIIFDQRLELLNTFIEDAPPENTNSSVWYLGKSIQLMAEADYFICFDTSLVNDVFKGCEIEKEVAAAYGIETFHIRDKIMELHILRDLAEVAMKVEHSESGYAWSEGLTLEDNGPVHIFPPLSITYNSNPTSLMYDEKE